ncbi:14922_t:CDS:2 [Acaulospora morrowiae]|uniref:14922_t:CDS:1 n=1 Tax=Acaulospora morrowiae TaxID=94023 RepID=A0A9N9BSS7_9GLOM|nr:14922_t:CDS:2 [Acaulospora morrowiae]
MSKSIRFPLVSKTVSVDRSKEITRKKDYLDLDQLDRNCAYTLEEFEIISDQLKHRSLKTKVDKSGEIVYINHFELDKSGKLVPIPPTPIFKEVAVVKICTQINSWNVRAGQNGVMTSSQEGFLIETGKARTLDVAFMPKETYRNLTVEQDSYFVLNISVELDWLIDPINDEIWVYKQNLTNGNVFCRHSDWGDLDGGDTLPGFKLKVWKVKVAILQELSESEPSESGDENTHPCHLCLQTFSELCYLIEHLEDDHVRKKWISRG